MLTYCEINVELRDRHLRSLRMVHADWTTLANWLMLRLRQTDSEKSSNEHWLDTVRQWKIPEQDTLQDKQEAPLPPTTAQRVAMLGGVNLVHVTA